MELLECYRNSPPPPPPTMHHHRATKKKPQPFPDELIATILLKLTIKPLIRFTTLSKSFRSLILLTPHFTTTHFHHHHRHHTPPKILHIDFHFNSTIPHSIPINTSLHNDSSHHTLYFPLHNFSHPVPIRGSTRGIILLDDYTNLFLWNPTTGFIRTLPYPPLASSPSTFSVSVGFGYDELNDDYVVVAASACGFRIRNIAARFEVFTTRTKSWSMIESDRRYYFRVEDQFGCFYNGSVHWLVQIEDRNWKYVIAVFDMSERRLSNEIELPLVFRNKGISSRLGVLGGFLSVCFSNVHKEVEIWVMREYRVSSSWSKHVVVKDYGPSHKLWPICINEDGEVVAKDDGFGLVKLDARGRLVELRAYSSMSTTALYVETLLSPAGFDEDDD